jgi:tetratricopeptide (TPR) repeat protein
LPLTKLRQHLAKSEYVQARREAERLVQMGELDDRDLVQANRAAALANYYLQEFFAAVNLGERALALATELQDWAAIGTLRYDLGEYYLKLGDLYLARQHLVQCLDEFHRYPESPALRARVYHNLGHVHRCRREYPSALAALQTAVELYGVQGNHRLRMETVRAIIWCYLEASDPDGALPYIDQVATYLQNNPDPALSAGHLTDLAYYHRLKGNTKLSMDFCEEALVPGRPGVDDRILATACVITGENALDLGQHQEARMFASFALDYALKAKHPFLMNLASSLRRRIHEVVSCSNSHAD